MHEAFVEARRVLESLIADEAASARVGTVAKEIAGRLRTGGKILAVGNGGSACDAMHFCEELTGRFRDDREPIAAIACGDGGHITCTANDYGFDEVFARWVRGLGRDGDVLVALSTSGNSPNVIRAVEAAREAGLLVVCLLGKGGGALGGRGDFEWIVAGETSDRIQELHMLILHTLVEEIEKSVR